MPLVGMQTCGPALLACPVPWGVRLELYLAQPLWVTALSVLVGRGLMRRRWVCVLSVLWAAWSGMVRRLVQRLRSRRAWM